MDKATKIRLFRDKHERALWQIIAQACCISNCNYSGETETQEIEMAIFVEKILKLIDNSKEPRRRTPANVATAAENVTVMVSKKA